MKPDPNDLNPAEPNIHSPDLGRICSWLFWSFALACGAVIVWLISGAVKKPTED